MIHNVVGQYVLFEHEGWICLPPTMATVRIDDNNWRLNFAHRIDMTNRGLIVNRKSSREAVLGVIDAIKEGKSGQ